jgi:6-phosphofructokinase 2
MEKVLTITLNPAIDKSTTMPALLPAKKLRCTPPKFEPGGRGINISRVLKKFGYPSTAMFLAGGFTGNFFEKLVQKEGIDTIVVPFNGYTRENFIVHDLSTDLQYRFGIQGPSLQESEWRECLKKLKEAEGFTYFVISGSNPAGVSLDFYSEAAEIVREKKGKLIIDTSGDALKHALSTGIFLAKPNIGELSSLLGVKELDTHSAVDAAKKIIETGHCEVLVVSMGPAGAALITAKEYFHEPAPAVKVKSTVGAGDSMVAGIIMALQRKLSWRDVLRYGVAAGTAATTNPGTELSSKEEVERIHSLFLRDLP